VFSPETVGGGGAEKTARRGGIPRRRRSFGGRGGGDRVLGRALTREDERAKKKGGMVATEHPL
jgi:hypothetical protein